MLKEIMLVTIGGCIGFVSSFGTLMASSWLEKRGKLKVYTKIVYSKCHKNESWGFYHSDSASIAFHIPLWVEIQNTSKETKVIRDFCIILYRNGNRIAKMIQINKIGEKGKEEFYGNNGGYSFIAEPRSIRRYECQFSILKNSIEGDSDFDEIKLRYFDERDNEIIYHLKSVKECWKISSFKKDDDWNLLC